MPEQTSPWKLGGLTTRELGGRVWKEIDHDNVLDRSAELSYYFFLSIWPGLFFVTSLLGIIAANSDLTGKLMSYVGSVLPGSTSQLINTTLREIINNHSGTKLWLGLLGALWTASAGMSTIESTLNITYDVREGRPYWKRKLIALALTVAVAALMITALLLITFGPMIADQVLGSIGHNFIAWVWKVVQWPVAVFFVLLAFSLVYYYAPDVEHPAWHWITPGSLAGVVLWLAVSFGLRVYLHFFNSYSATYGSLGTAIILMLWLYVSGAAMITGSEINAEIEHAAAEHGRPEAKAPGEKVPGEPRAA